MSILLALSLCLSQIVATSRGTCNFLSVFNICMPPYQCVCVNSWVCVCMCVYLRSETANCKQVFYIRRDNKILTAISGLKRVLLPRNKFVLLLLLLLFVLLFVLMLFERCCCCCCCCFYCWCRCCSCIVLLNNSIRVCCAGNTVIPNTQTWTHSHTCTSAHTVTPNRTLGRIWNARCVPSNTLVDFT